MVTPLAFVLVASLIMALAAVVALHGGRKLEGAAVARVASRKHVRIGFDHGARCYRFTYYNENGRKVARRNGIACHDVPRLRQLAHAKGYSSIVF